MKLSIRMVKPDDQAVLEALRREAFAPIFSSFRKILGDEIYELAQQKEDEQQSDLLAEMFSSESKWLLYVAEYDKVVGFVSILMDYEATVGEIGLNAVSPAYSGKGIGTEMYEFAIAKMRAEGMKVATVATGGDDSHAPARRAYEKSGFDVTIPSVWMCRTL